MRGLAKCAQMTGTDDGGRSTGAPAANDNVSVPLKWRRSPHRTPNPEGLFEFVRRYLGERGGVCGRSELEAAMTSDPHVSERLASSQGFGRILWNMHYGGWIEQPADIITATKKTLRRYSNETWDRSH